MTSVNELKDLRLLNLCRREMKSENNFNNFVLNYAKELKMHMILVLCFKLN